MYKNSRFWICFSEVVYNHRITSVFLWRRGGWYPFRRRFKISYPPVFHKFFNRLWKEYFVIHILLKTCWHCVLFYSHSSKKVKKINSFCTFSSCCEFQRNLISFFSHEEAAWWVHIIIHKIHKNFIHIFHKFVHKSSLYNLLFIRYNMRGKLCPFQTFLFSTGRYTNDQ